MPKGSPELTNFRKQEIINACEKLYQTKSFKEITLKEISSETSMTRTSIYNYFQTKEEIFLALLQREYELWNAELHEIMFKFPKLTSEEFSDKLAKSLEHRQQLLKIMSMNHYDMESNSRPERLAEFKVAYGTSLRMVMNCLEQYFPEMPNQEKQNFLYAFFPFMFGIYPYTFVTEKQRKAMELAGVDYAFMSIYELTVNFVRKMLNHS